MIKTGTVAVLIFSILVSICGACTMRVKKLSTYGINDPYFEFDPDIASWQDSTFILVSNGTVSTGESRLEKGDHEILLVAKGTPAFQVYPAIQVMADGQVLKEVPLDSVYRTYRIPMVLGEQTGVRISIRYDQDAVDDKGNDRNVFIKKVTVHAVTSPGQ